MIHISFHCAHRGAPLMAGTLTLLPLMSGPLQQARADGAVTMYASPTPAHSADT